MRTSCASTFRCIAKNWSPCSKQIISHNKLRRALGRKCKRQRDDAAIRFHRTKESAERRGGFSSKSFSSRPSPSSWSGNCKRTEQFALGRGVGGRFNYYIHAEKLDGWLSLVRQLGYFSAASRVGPGQIWPCESARQIEQKAPRLLQLVLIFIFSAHGQCGVFNLASLIRYEKANCERYSLFKHSAILFSSKIFPIQLFILI